MNPRVLSIVLLLLVAAGVALYLLPGVDTGPEVSTEPVVARSEPVQPRSEPSTPVPPRPSAAAAPEPVASTPVAKPPPPDGPVVPQSEQTAPSSPEFVGEQARQRVGFYERMFYSAHTAIPEGPAADEAREILDDALVGLRAVAERVATEELSFAEGVLQMVLLRDEAAEAIEGLVDEEVYETVSLRMGVRSTDYRSGR